MARSKMISGRDKIYKKNLTQQIAPGDPGGPGPDGNSDSSSNSSSLSSFVYSSTMSSHLSGDEDQEKHHIKDQLGQDED